MSARSAWLAAVLGFCLLAGALPAAAQLDENVLGLSDENIEGYLDPLRTGLSGTMNSAVFRTGYVPAQGLNFSIGVAAMAVGYDDEDRLYTPADPEGFISLDPTEVPTVVGDLDGVIVAGEGGLSQVYPGGFDLEGLEIAVPQVSIGSVMGTRAVVRYIALDLGDSDLGDFGYFGIGAQHSISQWIRGLPFDLAAGFFVQNFRIGDDIVKAKSLHANITGSKQFGILQPYLGLGFDRLSLDVKVEDEEDPELSVDAELESQTDFHLTLGALAKLPVVSFFFEYNMAAADGFSLGLDFGM
jgi:hypothetical protein